MLPVPTRDDLRATARLAAPIVVVQVGWQLMGVVDALMVGHVSPAALAAVSIGNLLWFNVQVLAFGLLMALDPIIAQAFGAGDRDGVSLGVQRGLVLAVLASALVSALLWPAEQLLIWLRQPADVIPLAAEWMRWGILGVLPLNVFTVGRQTLQAQNIVRPVIVATVVANLANVGLNWVFIYGNLGVEPMGVVGSAHSTWISRWLMAAMVWVAGWETLGPAVRPWRRAALDRAALWKMTVIGTPIGVQWFFEGFAFGVVTIWAGWLGTAVLAGHEVALNLAALTFMMPLGVSGAAAALVGQAIGRGDLDGARREAAAAFVIGVGSMAIGAVLFLALPRLLASAYTPDPATLAVAVALIPIAGAFQLFDGTQAVAGGVLRGSGDTRWPAVMHFAGFWGFGVPTSWWLGLHTPLGARGLWWGLVAGLAAAAVLQVLRVRRRLSGPVSRTTV
ncbi:MAG: MATE family efflux transporter [Gemmatimonadaceae bacterium]|nr:MATE family efflux transporter [Gemmatimonadaceae bacterium]